MRNVNLKVIAEKTEGFSGADLINLLQEAAFIAVRREQPYLVSTLMNLPFASWTNFIFLSSFIHCLCMVQTGAEFEEALVEHKATRIQGAPLDKFLPKA